MATKFLSVSTTLSSALAAAGTFTVGYPTGTDEDSFAGYGHKAVAIGNVMSSPGDFTLTFNSASIQFTYGSGKTTLPVGTKVSLDLNLRLGLEVDVQRDWAGGTISATSLDRYRTTLNAGKVEAPVLVGCRGALSVAGNGNRCTHHATPKDVDNFAFDAKLLVCKLACGGWRMDSFLATQLAS